MHACRHALNGPSLEQLDGHGDSHQATRVEWRPGLDALTTMRRQRMHALQGGACQIRILRRRPNGGCRRVVAATVACGQSSCGAGGGPSGRHGRRIMRTIQPCVLVVHPHPLTARDHDATSQQPQRPPQREYIKHRRRGEPGSQIPSRTPAPLALDIGRASRHGARQTPDCPPREPSIRRLLCAREQRRARVGHRAPCDVGRQRAHLATGVPRSPRSRPAGLQQSRLAGGPPSRGPVASQRPIRQQVWHPHPQPWPSNACRRPTHRRVCIPLQRDRVRQSCTLG